MQEGAFDELEDEHGVAEFIHGMLERKDQCFVSHGVGLFAKTVQLSYLISAALQNNKLTHTMVF